MLFGSEGSWLIRWFEEGAWGNPWTRRLAFALWTWFIWSAYARVSEVESWRFPVVMVLAVVAFEIAIVVLKLYERDHGVAADDLPAVRRRGTLVATAVLAGVLVLAAVICMQPWYGVLAVLFAYVGFLFSRYMPDALFGCASAAS
jgi:hypothetical protein